MNLPSLVGRCCTLTISPSYQDFAKEPISVTLSEIPVSGSVTTQGTLLPEQEISGEVESGCAQIAQSIGCSRKHASHPRKTASCSPVAVARRGKGWNNGWCESRLEHDQAAAARLIWPAERVRKRGAARREAFAGYTGKAKAKTRRTRISRKRAGRACELRHGELTIVLHSFEAWSFENDAVIVNAIPAANNSFSSSKRIPGKAHARAKRFFVGRAMEVEYIRQPHTRPVRLKGQIGARAVRTVVAEQIGVIFPAQPEVQREIGRTRQSSCT